MRFRKPHSGLAEADWTPMIDMTFQLIAFLMVLVNFSEADQDQRIMLPSSTLAKPPEGPIENAITIQLLPDGSILFAGDVLDNDGLRRYLIRERDILRIHGKASADATIIIRADAAVPAGKVQELIQLCQSERFEKFTLRAREKLD